MIVRKRLDVLNKLPQIFLVEWREKKIMLNCFENHFMYERSFLKHITHFTSWRCSTSTTKKESFFGLHWVLKIVRIAFFFQKKKEIYPENVWKLLSAVSHDESYYIYYFLCGESEKDELEWERAIFDIRKRSHMLKIKWSKVRRVYIYISIYKVKYFSLAWFFKHIRSNELLSNGLCLNYHDNQYIQIYKIK